MELYRFMADIVVVVHATYIGVVVFGLLAILVGRILRWQWVRNFWFRAIHLGMIAIVVAQALANVTCPLTTLEQNLRDKAGEATYTGSFIGHWVHELIFYEAPHSVFTAIYCVFGAVVVLTLLLVPPRWPGRRSSRRETAC
jgi:uncharacterized membrane protein YeaQ/YmgE (transglycosylase-associated protein family)